MRDEGRTTMDQRREEEEAGRSLAHMSHDRLPDLTFSKVQAPHVHASEALDAAAAAAAGGGGEEEVGAADRADAAAGGETDEEVAAAAAAPLARGALLSAVPPNPSGPAPRLAGRTSSAKHDMSASPSRLTRT